MNTQARQKEIIKYLRRNSAMTVSDLSLEVGVSRRTALRDIATLRAEGFVIHSESGRGGGLQLDPLSVQVTPRLSVLEIFALIISVSSMRAAQSLPFSSLAESGLDKIESSLPKDKIKDLRRLLNCLYIGKLAPKVDTSNIGKMDSNLLPSFEEAFLNKHKLSFKYLDAKKTKTQRLVEPQAILILPPLWYLVAWDDSRQDFRHFRMDRIIKPSSIENTSFQRRKVLFQDNIRSIRKTPYP